MNPSIYDFREKQKQDCKDFIALVADPKENLRGAIVELVQCFDKITPDQICWCLKCQDIPSYEIGMEINRLLFLKILREDKNSILSIRRDSE
jgi:hypothetical protein